MPHDSPYRMIRTEYSRSLIDDCIAPVSIRIAPLLIPTLRSLDDSSHWSQNDDDMMEKRTADIACVIIIAWVGVHKAWRTALLAQIGEQEGY